MHETHASAVAHRGDPAAALPATVRVALLGYGTVGASLHRLLDEHRQHILEVTGRDLVVDAALVRDTKRDSAGLELLTDPAELLDRGPDLVCEALGGLEPARTIILDALTRGIPVVTANKQLLAHHGAELLAAAEQAGTQLRFEASVCGAIPIVRMLRESLTPSRIDELEGILNGTTNFILTAMSEAPPGAESGEESSYARALARAQELGYAEADPGDDVEGRDAAAKLAILAGLAFHVRADIADVRVTGITGVTDADVAHARDLGCTIKLVGRATRLDEQRALLDVSPALVPLAHPLARVDGSDNAVLVRGEPFGRLVVRGPGAGGPETASAMAGDIVGALGSTPSFLTRDPHHGHLVAAGPEERVQRHYIRLEVPDRPGVLAAVAGRFAERGVSIERVVQRTSGAGATLVLTTHPAAVTAVESALDGVEDAGRSVMPMLADPNAEDA